MSLSTTSSFTDSASRQRGAAYVEALLVLLVLPLLWYGARELGDQGLAALQANSQARRCAWAHALSACSRIPEECSAPERSQSEPPEKLGAIGDSASTSAGPATGAEVASSDSQAPTSSALQEAANKVWGARATFTVERESSYLSRLSHDKWHVASRQTLPCAIFNAEEEQKNADSVGTAVFDAERPPDPPPEETP